MDATFGQFVSVMRNGPTKHNLAGDSDYELVELLVRWGLELATHEGLAIAFAQPRV
jgi:hypothetical protein